MAVMARAFIEERAAAKRDGEDCAETALVFGARNQKEGVLN